MQKPPFERKPLARRQGIANAFTLVELLVAMAILAMLAMLIGKMVGVTSEMSILTTRRMDVIDETRTTLDWIGSDFKKRVKRKDVPYAFTKFTGNDSLGFYCEVENYEGERRVAAVEYRLELPVGQSSWVLKRGVKGVGWEDGTGVPFSMPFPGMAADRFDVLSNAVVRMEFTYLKTDGTLSNSAAADLSDVTALVLAVAVVDTGSLKTATPASLTDLAEALDDCAEGEEPIKAWHTAYFAGNFAPSVPLPVKQSLRFSQRYYYVR